jgi:hypothetical protein
MTLQFSDIDDAVLLTQQELVKRGAFVDLQTDLSDHVAVREVWKNRQRKFEGGNPWEFEIQTDHNHSARAVGLYETDGGAINDTMAKGTVQPRHINAFYEYDQREPDFQRGGVSIVDLVQTRYTAMMVSLYEYLEAVLWGKPSDSSDTKTPYGIGYWVTQSNTSGFNGPDPVGFTGTGKAGILAATYPKRWQNWTGQYTDVSKEDLLRKMCYMALDINFRSPVTHSTPELGNMKNGIYTNRNTYILLKELLEQQNMSLGGDLDSYEGKVRFQSSPVTYVPYLNGACAVGTTWNGSVDPTVSNSNNPVFMLDWKWLACGVLEGWENQLTKPYMVPGRHLVRRVDLDCTLQMVCTNLRRQGVLTTGA